MYTTYADLHAGDIIYRDEITDDVESYYILDVNTNDPRFPRFHILELPNSIHAEWAPVNEVIRPGWIKFIIREGKVIWTA